MNSKDVNFMMNSMRVGRPLTSNQSNKTNHSDVKINNSFSDVLNKVQHGTNKTSKTSKILFSKHATQRLKNRNITLDSEQMQKLTNAIDKADRKGVREALILMDNKAFIAHVKNRTIITAAAEEQLADNVFTNIDGAVIA